MEDKLALSRQDYMGGGIIIKPCIVKECNEKGDLLMCKKHLECKEKDSFQIIEGVEIREGARNILRGGTSNLGVGWSIWA